MADPKLPFAPVLRSPADLERTWRALAKPPGPRRRRLSFFLVGADSVPLPMMTDVEGFPAHVDVDAVDRVARLWRSLLLEFAPDGGVAALLSRPGRGAPAARDRLLAAALYDGCRMRGVRTEVIYLATDVAFHPIRQARTDRAGRSDTAGQ